MVLGGALDFWKELGDCVSCWELFSLLEPGTERSVYLFSAGTFHGTPLQTCLGSSEKLSLCEGPGAQVFKISAV